MLSLCTMQGLFYVCVDYDGGVGSSYYQAERNFALWLYCL